MSDGYRSVALQSLIYVAIGLLAFGAIMFFWSLGYSLGEDQGNSSYSAEYHENYATDRIERECLSGDVSSLELHECIQKQIEASQERETAQNDLKAQSRMALWAAVMGVFTGLAVIVTGIGVVFVYRTLLATQDMARETTRIGEAQTRAYLGIDTVKAFIFNDGGELTFRYEITIKNSGNSPAIGVDYDIQILSDNFEGIRNMRPMIGGGTDIIPGAGRTLRPDPNISITPTNWGGSGRIRIYFGAKYRTIYQREDDAPEFFTVEFESTLFDRHLGEAKNNLPLMSVGPAPESFFRDRGEGEDDWI